MTKGLHVRIYRPGDGGAANGGLSERYDTVTLTGAAIVGGPFEPCDQCPEVQLEPANIGPGYKVVPVEQPAGMIGPMFGGCFVFSSDARFPSDQPIALHDRWETPEEYEALSR